MAGRTTGEAREAMRAQAKQLYDEGYNLVTVASKLGISYGKAHALLKEAGVQSRARGTVGKKPV